jgi:predicted GNAT superfamily acetyltransferase
VGSDFTIRRFASIAEFKECVRFQEEIWGEGFSERVPVAILKVSQRLGGIAAGAFDAEGNLAGFVFGMTGMQEGEVVHWSDMLAVRPELQNVGLGALLKVYQREELVSKGVMRMHWTFGPLEAKNTHFNLNKLGAVVGEYVRDMYGRTDSPLHKGISTDRFIPIWAMDSPRVTERLVEGRPGRPPRCRPGGAADVRRPARWRCEPSGRAGSGDRCRSAADPDSGLHPGVQRHLARGRTPLANRHARGPSDVPEARLRSP